MFETVTYFLCPEREGSIYVPLVHDFYTYTALSAAGRLMPCYMSRIGLSRPSARPPLPSQPFDVVSTLESVHWVRNVVQVRAILTSWTITA